ncbi:hypothetical protein Hanom_Chr08g00711941 [Helianthus anomalus]
MAGMETISKNDLHHEFIEKGYEARLVGATLFKPKFPPAMKFFFHTLLVCMSAKTTTLMKFPLKPRYLGYAILKNPHYKLSQTLFMDLVANIKAIKRGIGNPFL